MAQASFNEICIFNQNFNSLCSELIRWIANLKERYFRKPAILVFLLHFLLDLTDSGFRMKNYPKPCQIHKIRGLKSA